MSKHGWTTSSKVVYSVMVDIVASIFSLKLCGPITVLICICYVYTYVLTNSTIGRHGSRCCDLQCECPYSASSRGMHPKVHVHPICVCTLCSCYPSVLLGLSPAWYRSRSYGARTIREPRSKILTEFGTILDSDVSVHVHDLTADCRFMVLL